MTEQAMGAPRDGEVGPALVSDQAAPHLGPSGFDPARWVYTHGVAPLASGPIYALGRFGDVYGPIPCEMLTHTAWEGFMFHASHDLIAFQKCLDPWPGLLPADEAAAASRDSDGSGEADKTGTGLAGGDSAGLKGIAQKDQSHV